MLSSTRSFSSLASLVALLVTVPAVAQAPAPPKPPQQPARPAAQPAPAPQRGPAAPAQPAAPAKPAPVPEPPTPGAAEPPPTSMDAIVKALDTPYRPKPGGHQVKFNLQDADLAELVNHISGLTGKRFIYGPKVRQIKVTVVSPTPVSINEAYEAFLSILEANGMTVVPQGQFLKIVDSGGIVNQTTPVYSRGAPVPDTDRFVTRLYRARNVSANEVSQLLGKFKSKEGDISVYEPGGLIIMTDRGSNINRMVRILEEVDVTGEGAQMWIEPVHYGTSGEVAKQINEIFELGGPGGGKGAGGLQRVIADEQTNSLIVVGTEDSYNKLLELLRRIDSAPAAQGNIHVLPLQHAVAEELAATLTQMLSGVGQRGQAGAPGGGGIIAGLFEGEVRVTADKPTNSLVVTSSGRDFAQLRLVIEKLDQPRRQVFIEAVIMDVSVERTTQLGLAYHGGTQVNPFGAGDSLLVAGFQPLKSIAPGPEQLQGAALGVRGPDIAGTQNTFPGLAGLSIPAFGIILNALATSGDVNILATPHILATDNTPAEINVGENIPLQTNFAGLPNLGSLAGLAGGAGAQQGGAGGLAALGALGGFGGFGSAPRQDVGIRIKVTPHVNDDHQVRFEIEEEFSQPGPAAGNLGVVSITQRTANTTVIVDDQQTVVIGGLMRDSLEKTRTKIPVLGDLPVLGFLFRESHTRMRKANLLLIMTPYVILDQADLRKVFERKMQERQEFLDRYFVFTSDWEPPQDFSRTNGLVEEIRQSYRKLAERLLLEAESQPRAKGQHVGTIPIALAGAVRTGPAPAVAGPQGGPPPAAVPGAPQEGEQAPRRRRRRREGAQPGAQPPQQQAPPGVQGAPPPGGPPPMQPQGAVSPVQINPVARSVNVERTE